MVKEEITLLDDTKVEYEVKRFGFRKAMQVAKLHIPINDLTFNKDGSMSLKGDIDLFGLSESCLETIEGLDLDNISSEEATRVYKIYFEKDVMSSLGQGGSPN